MQGGNIKSKTFAAQVEYTLYHFLAKLQNANSNETKNTCVDFTCMYPFQPLLSQVRVRVSSSILRSIILSDFFSKTRLFATQVFSQNIHDPSLPIPIQTTSVRLLLNLVDYIFHNEDPDAQRGKRLLQRVLKVCMWGGRWCVVVGMPFGGCILHAMFFLFYFSRKVLGGRSLLQAKCG